MAATYPPVNLQGLSDKSETKLIVMISVQVPQTFIITMVVAYLLLMIHLFKIPKLTITSAFLNAI